MGSALVTGGAGFIGSHIVRALLDQGKEVRVLDNFSSGKRENLEGLHGSLEIIEGDLSNPADVVKAINGVDEIYHQAAFVSVPESMQKPDVCFEVNVVGTIGLFEMARRAGVRRVVIASSAAVYGDSTALPLTEDTSLRPLSPYAVSKRVGEMYASLYTQAFGLEVVALRYFNVYGPRQRPDSMYAAAVPIFSRHLKDGEAVTVFGNGGQTRDLIFVGDVVRANLIAAEHPAAAGRVFNICTGHETRILDLLEVLLDLFPNVPQAEFSAPRPGDIYRSVGDPTLAEQILGFKAQTSLADGLKETVEWMK